MWALGGSSPPQQHCHCLWPPKVTPCTALPHMGRPRAPAQFHSHHLAPALCVSRFPDNYVGDTLPVG